MRKGNLFIISGPSGAGKGTLVNLAMHRVGDAWLSVSATTRKPRKGEVDGQHYFFVSNDEFDAMVEQDRLLEWAQVHANRYGTPRETVEQHIAAGNQVILEIDVQGALQVREKMPSAKLVFIEPPSMDVLESRLRGRGTEAEDVIALRMKNAETELALKNEYDISFINDDLDECADALVAYIEQSAEEKDE
ncbi:Guanylate kinase [Slackia heliotrinireducens]|uniref:guanylate kinase n=1 Tax=Slackia heliotrinireducens TaxID=84110 RepID=UPI00022513B6|nr:guanylate kinase [Slackia heliotrinireducens]VEH00350.1 Guanylate kinase [Slackia heliotrinireducens]